MRKYMGNVPRLLDISAKCIDVKFPDVRGIVDLVMLSYKIIFALFHFHSIRRGEMGIRRP